MKTFYICSFDVQHIASNHVDPLHNPDFAYQCLLQWMPLEEYAAQPFVQNNESFNLVSKICLAKENDRYTGFSPLPTITAFSAKEIYLYFNHQNLSKIIVPTR